MTSVQLSELRAIPPAAESSPGLVGTPSATALENDSSSSEPDERSETTIASDGEGQDDVLHQLICTGSSNKIHMAVPASEQTMAGVFDGFRPACNRRILHGRLISSSEVEHFLEATPLGVPCELCFPVVSESHQCICLCGHPLPSGFCSRRCCHERSAGFTCSSYHRCSAHDIDSGELASLGPAGYKEPPEFADK